MLMRPFVLAIVIVGALSCHEAGESGVVAEDTAGDTTFVEQDSAGEVGNDLDVDTAPELCLVEGGFGCPCGSNADCLDELCIEGPDGNFCTKTCEAECPEAFACLNTSLAGSDPISICVPRHTRLCRPCSAQSDCQSPLDPAPAACLPGPQPEDGRFCATSCAQDPCPDGYECEDIAVGESTAKLCRPSDDVCECRPAWAALGFSTTCARVNELGTCLGSRECTPDGLSACSALQPVAEVCDLADNDCNDTVDDIVGEACELDNDEGICPGLTACDEAGQVICTGREPSGEVCNLVDDDCDGETDEAWPDCPPGSCELTDTGYVESGAPQCVAGHCVNPNPRPCGNYTCSGGGEEGDVCATSCEDDTTCIEEAHCDEGECVLDTLSGEGCEEDHDCASEHCQNGFCCDEGDCCSDAADCPESYHAAPVCDDAATCQGTRIDARCLDAMCAPSEPIDDDSACDSETQALDCSPMVPRFCTGTLSQEPPVCPSGCVEDNECIEGYHCDDTCVPDVEPGGGCDENSDCAAGVCASGVCCDSPCEGSCRSCTVAGLEGTCSDIPGGEDPDEECGGNACTGYYFGFVEKTCYLRAPVEDGGVFCDGAGACQSDVAVCSLAAQGAASTSCHPECQEPTDKTCTGTTPGACTNITGGEQECGVGACRRTTDRCSGGVPAVCTPGDPAPEVCDGIDNDCDGLTDAADTDLVRIPCENQNGVCAGSMRPAYLCSGGVWGPCDDVVYSGHDTRYQPGMEQSCETTLVQLGLDNDCDGNVDEDFTYHSPAGTTIQGAARPCGVGVCAGGLTVCGIAGGLICSNDYQISTEVCDGEDNDCDGLLDSLDTNGSPLEREECENQQGVCDGAEKPNSLCAAGQWQPCTADSYRAHTSDYVSEETDQCDGLDNDCDGGVDNDLDAPLNSNQLGACAGTKQACGGGSGWQDDYASVTGYGQLETPSASFADENCDGIDGDVSIGLFVVAGAPNSGSCTMNTPCSLTRALSIANDTRSQIYIREGSYTGPFDIPTVVQIFGGYAGNEWSRADRGTNTVVINGGNVSPDNHTAAFMADGIGSSGDRIVIADLVIRGSNATARVNNIGASSYGIFGSGSFFRLERVEVSGGSGMSGAGGGNGQSATSTRAPNGTVGQDAEESSQACGLTRPSGGSGGFQSCSDSTSTRAGGGGSGGAKDTCCDNPCDWTGGSCWECTSCNCDATSGGGGGNATVTSNPLGTGGSGGRGLDWCEIGQDGHDGRVVHGSAGSGAAAENAYGYLDANDFWFSLGGGAGTLGENGGGGGGGGGSGGCDIGIDSTGAGGGGGGAGGCRAPVTGKGGYGGGGSFGLYAVGGGFQVIGPSTLLVGAGGAGGKGGNGGTGQPGGLGRRGGFGSGDSLPGGAGGDGGQGGHAGAGGGGAGGANIAALIVDGSWSTSGTITYNNSLPSGAPGGPGGTTGISGGTGVTGPVAKVRECTFTSVWGIRFLQCN